MTYPRAARIVAALVVAAFVAGACTNTDRYEPKFGPPVAGNASVFDKAVVDKDGNVYVAAKTQLMRLEDGRRVEVSGGWVNPDAFTFDERGRLWVADQARPDGKELVARGKERNGAKRRRFATALPAGSKPVGIAAIDDELFVCRSGQGDVYRLHVGIDDVARRRGVVPGLKCDTAIVSLADGSLVTATGDDIRRYPPRR
ncbi:MAG: hypothetical protein QOF21_3069 [Actinomycetota bacterium]|jgi:hypothetical protein